jgi:hypothetical protein
LQEAILSLPAFCKHFCQILRGDGLTGTWGPFTLWPEQERVCTLLEQHKKIAALKARQLGFTWIALAHVLRAMLFRPVATVILFSKSDDDAMELVGFRLRGMYERLPDWLKAGKLKVASDHELELPNGSRAMSFATTGGRSYTATHAVIDEADFVPDLPRLLNAVEPTVDAGGQLVLISTVDKDKPESAFKGIYRAALAKQGTYHPVFLPWHARPTRTAEWYEGKKQDSIAATGSLDNLYQEYPATPAEALAPRSSNARLPAEWLLACYAECPAVTKPGAPALPGLVVYDPPRPGGIYVVSGDPAEGNPTSDDSASCVLDCETGEEVAFLAGKFQLDPFADYLAQLATWYNCAPLMVERNNHGHAVLSWLRHHAPHLQRLRGHDDRPGVRTPGLAVEERGRGSAKEGWLSSTLGKSLLYDRTAEALREKEVILHTFSAYLQLCSIEGATNRAPEGLHDDKATAFALCVVGRPHALRLGHGSGWKSPLQRKREAAARQALAARANGAAPPAGADVPRAVRDVRALAKRFGLAPSD